MPRTRLIAACLAAWAASGGATVAETPPAVIAPALEGASGDDLDISTDSATDITWYRPRFEFWQIDDFKIYPAVGESQGGARKMVLTIVVKDPPSGLPDAVHVSGGEESWIIPISDPRSIVSHDSGCRVTQTISLQNQADAVLNLIDSSEVELRLTGYGRPLRYKVSPRDLKGIQQVARLWNMPRLPSAKGRPPGPKYRDDGTAADVRNPELIRSSKVQPRFPKKAQGKNVLGRVELQAVIRKDGTVGEITVLEGAGGDCGFEAAAVEALSRWRYKPGTVDGEAVDVYFTVRMDFTYGDYKIAR